jgi:hypothetical protein
MNMKKRYSRILLTLLLVSAPAWAVLPPSGGSIGVFFDVEGTVVSLNAFPSFTELDAYIIVYWEAMVGGAAYSIPGPPPGTMLAVEEWPDGINIGSAFDGTGCEVGLFLPGFGYYGTPVLMSHIKLFNYTGGGLSIFLCVQDHGNYADIVLSDNQSNLFSAEGYCAVVGTETSTWGAVKDMYR